jgi:hypothetical protein
MTLFKKPYQTNFFEPFIIIAFWALLFTSPLLFGRFEDEIDWNHIFKVWLTYLPLLGLFFINRFLLLPKLFFKGKRLQYLIWTLLLIISMAAIFFAFESKKNRSQFPPPDRLESRDFQQPPPPEFSVNERPVIPPRESRPESIPMFANFLILAVLLVGFDTGLQISMRWASLEQEKMKLQKEGVENQLAILKYQVSPHFFMNTLNNIHALVDIDTVEAKSAIIKLSNLMRHLLYESEGKTTPIKKEIEFIKSYIELMRLRFSDKVKINVKIPSEIPDKSIPPLLFTSLLENAFKHGISYNKQSFINISISFLERELQFSIENSNHPEETLEASGIGLENTKQRLALLFQESFDLNFSETKDMYKVNLNIPI